MLRRLTVLTFLFLALACSGPQGGDLAVERMGNNSFPLEVCGLTRDGSRVQVRYLFQSKSCLCSNPPFFVGPDPGIWTVSLNGAVLSSFNGRYDLSGMVHEGENVLELCGEGEVAPAFLEGEFSVHPAEDGGWVLGDEQGLRLGSVQEQGLPFYHGAVSYSRSFELPDKVGKRFLRLGKWEGTACEVWVNGQKAGTLQKKEQKMRVDSFLSPGENIVQLVLEGAGGMDEDFTIK